MRKLRSQNHFSKLAATVACILVVVSASAQTKPNPERRPTKPAQTQAATPAAAWPQDLDKYPGLLPEFGELFQKLQHDVHFPPARSQSRLLPLLPESSTLYMALPNYGDVVQQALTAFRRELQQSAVLRDWWQHGEVAAAGPKIEQSLEMAYQLFHYLGDEIVVSGATENKDPSFLMLAEIRKPGLKDFLQGMSKELAGASTSSMRVLDVQELAMAQEGRPGQALQVVVRPDYVVAAMDVASLRRFNERLDRSRSEFASTPFGQRVARAYEGGATVVGAADLQRILSKAPGATKDASFQRSGFSEAQYLVWEHKTLAGQEVSQAELSFTGPRHGVASWLAPPLHPGSLEFVSPKAILVATLALASPAQIFEQIKQLSTASNPAGLANIDKMEKALNLRLKEDLLAYLAGEITIEVDSATPEQPAARVILRVNDPARLQQTLTTLLASMNLRAQRAVESGVTYFDVQVPSSTMPIQPAYAFVDGYLVIASSHNAVTEAVRLHRSGESLATSTKFLAALPAGHESGVSAMIYQDPIAMTALRLRTMAPAMAPAFAKFTGESKPTVIGVYAEENAIREASTNSAMDAGMILAVAAIAIPNLLRSRNAANEATAVGKMRTLNTAQVVYASTYPQRGFARNLAMLGPGPTGATASPDHAGFIDALLGNPTCAAGAWCADSTGYRFSLKAVCLQDQCTEYLAVATPVSGSTGGRNFCSTSNGIIRYQIGPPLNAPITLQECRKWQPLK